ncbi:STY0301 family protein [Dyella sp.]|uniref:STY0301 family protein n=1 Tax=Dyella sp. TaxID=1869338 RepID=UPI0039C8B1C3
MSSSKLLITAMAACFCVGCQAASKHRYECPSPLVDAKGKHTLVHVDVFDGPPKDKAFLQVLTDLKGLDPYLVCTYQGTDKVVTIHAVGASSCAAPDEPNTAYCD